MTESVLTSRVDRAEKDIDDQRQRTHGIAGDLATVASDLRALTVEVGELRTDQRDQSVVTDRRLQSIARWFMFAGTTFIALAAAVIGVLAKGG